MRVTGGVLAGFTFPTGFASHVRPTTDRVRESIMNMLNHQIDLEGLEVLDLFSGSGIMAGEFLSYGAKRVVSIDCDLRNYSYQTKLQKSQIALANWEIHKKDVFTFLGGNLERFDLIFADPPYDLGNLHVFPQKVMPHLKPEGLFLFEHQPQLLLHQPADTKKEYGSTTLSIFESNFPKDE